MHPSKRDTLAENPVVLLTRGQRVVVALTARRIRDIATPEKGQSFVWDSEMKGFGVRTTCAGVQSYIIQRRVNGRNTRITLARVGDISLKDAKTLGTKRLGEIADNRDPIKEKRDAATKAVSDRALEKVKALTLGEAFDQYLEARTLKPTTVADYERIVGTDFKDWKKKRLVDISGDMVAKRHRRLLEQAQKQSNRYCRKATGARANNAMRVLRAVINFHADILEEHGIELRNPVKRLKKSWHPAKRKSTYLNETDLPVWWAALGKVESTKMKDFLHLVLLTGLRLEEAATLLWSNVDFNNRTLKIIDPKNHRDHVLPLSDFTFALLKQRDADKGKSCFVFTGRDVNKDKPLRTPWKVLQTIRNDTGIACSVHDLRRTFAVAASGLAPYPVVKRLLNHRDGNDVSLGYTVPDLAELRGHMQRVTDKLLRLATKTTADVVQLHG